MTDAIVGLGVFMVGLVLAFLAGSRREKTNTRLRNGDADDKTRERIRDATGDGDVVERLRKLGGQ